MDTNYKSELEYSKADFAQRIIDRETEPSENSKKEANKITSDTISKNFEKIENRKYKKDVMQALSIILSYSRKNFFENLTCDNIKNIFFYATEKNEEEEQNDMDLKQISKLARNILLQILHQPEPANMFIETGFLYQLHFYFNDTWAILSLATICKISQKNRDKIYEFGFIGEFIDSISEKVTPIIDFGASCELAKSFIKYEMSYPEQNKSVREIFPILYELVDSVVLDEKSVKFLDAASKLIPHIEYSEKYLKEENLIHNIFPLLPNDQSINNDKPILPIIEKKINVSKFNDQNEKWFETSADYIYDWLRYTFFQNQAREDIESYDFNPLWMILLKILETSHFLKASKTAASSLVLLIKIDIDSFMNNQYYSAIVEEFPNNCHAIKKDLLAVIAIAFYRATNEQMNQLLDQSNIFDLIFETLGSIEFDNNDHLSDIILGLHRFIDFCGYSQEGMVAFNDLVITNEDFENWVEQLIGYTNELNEDENQDQNLIKKAQDLNNIIHQRIKEYEISMNKMQSTEE